MRPGIENLRIFILAVIVLTMSTAALGQPSAQLPTVGVLSAAPASDRTSSLYQQAFEREIIQ